MVHTHIIQGFCLNKTTSPKGKNDDYNSLFHTHVLIIAFIYIRKSRKKKDGTASKRFYSQFFLQKYKESVNFER